MESITSLTNVDKKLIVDIYFETDIPSQLKDMVKTLRVFM